MKLFNYVLMYGVLLPLSWLPMWILHGISKGIAFVLHRVWKYRKAVVRQNLQQSFPDKTAQEIERLVSDFYLHLADMIVEGIKMLSISKKGVLKRYQCENPEVMQPFERENRSVIWVSGHQNNWEFLVLSLGMQFPHHGIGVGKRLSNSSMGEILHHFRTRYGTEVVYADNMREAMEGYERKAQPVIYMMLADQSPNDAKKCYWTTFLNQETPVIYGPEYFAKKYNYPILFYSVKKIKRGYYSYRLHLITDAPQKTAYGELTDAHVSLLEKSIALQPAYWLWSHRRWKHRRAD